VRYNKIVNVVVFAILNAFTLRKEEEEDKDKEHPPPTARRRFVGGGVLLLWDDEKRGVDKDTTEFETIIYILLEERMNNTIHSRVTRKEKKSLKNRFFTRNF
jgi:hypothetical protein